MQIPNVILILKELSVSFTPWGALDIKRRRADYIQLNIILILFIVPVNYST
jgi:hypothetical protein